MEIYVGSWSVYGYYNQELKNWLRNHPGRTVTHFQVAEIFKSAYIKSATVQNAQHGFAKTGICPYNANIFPEYMFAPAEVTNIAQNAENAFHEAGPSTSSAFPSVEVTITTAEQLDANANLPGKDGETAADKSVDDFNMDNNNNNISVADISPLPVTSATERKTNRRKGKYGHLNTTPEIHLLKEKNAEKVAKLRRKSAQTVKRRVVTEPDETPEDPFSVSGDENEDAACIYCNDMFSRSRSKEIWLRCYGCGQWCHAECAGVNKTTENFVCDICGS